MTYVYIAYNPLTIDWYLESKDFLKYRDMLLFLGKRAYPKLVAQKRAGLDMRARNMCDLDKDLNYNTTLDGLC